MGTHCHSGERYANLAQVWNGFRRRAEMARSMDAIERIAAGRSAA